MSEPTPRVIEAAEAIVDAFYNWCGPYDKETKRALPTEIAKIINAKTGLPELLKERNELCVELSRAIGFTEGMQRETGRDFSDLVERFNNALARHERKGP